MEIDAESAESQAILGMVLDWSGRAHEAMTPLLRAVQLNPSLAEAHAYLAEGYADTDRLVRAQETIAQAVGLEPEGASEPATVETQALESLVKELRHAAPAPPRRPPPPQLRTTRCVVTQPRISAGLSSGSGRRSERRPGRRAVSTSTSTRRSASAEARHRV